MTVSDDTEQSQFDSESSNTDNDDDFINLPPAPTAEVSTLRSEASCSPNLETKDATTQTELIECYCNKNDKILEILIDLKLQVQCIQENLNHRTGDRKENFDKIIKKLPLINIGTLQEFETLMNDDLEAKEQFLQFIRRVGGNNAKNSVGRMCKETFSNQFAVNCSCLGFRNNHRIYGTTVANLIKETILATYHQETDCQVSHYLSEWLRLAKLRLGRKTRGPKNNLQCTYMDICMKFEGNM